jgi:hypothetical protein
LPIDSIRAEERVLLERKFDKDEILQALQSSNGDKASDPDGFTMGFSQKCWRVVESDVMVVFEEFHELCTFEKSLALIPKKKKCSEYKGLSPY